MEKRIAFEEAQAFGGRFNKTEIEIGVGLEEEVLKDWRIKAMAESSLRMAGGSSSVSSVTEDKKNSSASFDQLLGAQSV